MAEAAEPPKEVLLRSKEDYIAYIYKEAPSFHVEPKEAIRVIACETGNTWDPSIQSGYYKDGVREDSWGLAQLNRPLTKGITYAEAKDAKFSIDYLLSHWHSDHWSCM